MAIRSFADKCTEAGFHGVFHKRIPPELRKIVRRKLRMLDAAVSLESHRHPPGNHLEALDRDRIGQHSIRVNKQWRICFRWEGEDAFEVEFTDYH